MSDLLRLEDVACARGGRLLVRHLSLALGPGEALRLHGPNGAGKSSLLRLVGGLLRPLSGRVERTVEAALVDERPGFAPDRPLAAELSWWTGGPVAPAMAALGIAHLADVPVRHLSLGQTRRAALARAVAGGERLWLLDEPSAALDEDGRDRLARIVADHRAGGGAVLLADHRTPDWPAVATLSLSAYAPPPELA